jgi:hypothetical protein
MDGPMVFSLLKINYFGRDSGKREPLHIVGGNIN